MSSEASHTVDADKLVRLAYLLDRQDILDCLEKRDGQWRIALRSNAIEWSGLIPTMDIPFADVADLHLNGLASRSKQDPSYQRPLTNKREKHLP